MNISDIMKKSSILLLFVLVVSCYKGPEDLPKFKKKFKAQIASFESQKDKTNAKVENGVKNLGTIQEALANASNTDKEFKRVYAQWNKVDNNINGLYKDYERLKGDADNLFGAMERQTAGLNDQTMKNELTAALAKSKGDYAVTLANTEKAITKLRTLHDEAIDIVKGLEVAISLGQIAEITDGLKNIQARIPAIMAELNNTIKDSKDLYEQRMGGV